MKTEKQKRIKRTVLTAVLFILCGFIYSAFFSAFQVGIPCVFYEITGLKCPGCGITRGMVALLHFDFYNAICYNAFLFLIIAYIVWVYIFTARHYIRTGIYKLTAGREFISIIFLVLLLLWGIVRNIFGF